MKSFRDDDDNDDNEQTAEVKNQDDVKPHHTKNISSIIDFNQNIESSRLQSEMADFDNTAQDIPEKRNSKVEGSTIV